MDYIFNAWKSALFFPVVSIVVFAKISQLAGFSN